MKGFIAAILIMGVVRFLLSISAVPNSTAKFFSMTAVIVAGVIYFAATTRSHLDRLATAFLLILPYMVVEVLALGYTWVTGHQTVFHAEEYSFGFSIGQHMLGHLIGGLTWEPIGLFLLMELIWAAVTISSRLIGKS